MFVEVLDISVRWSLFVRVVQLFSQKAIIDVRQGPKYASEIEDSLLKSPAEFNSFECCSTVIFVLVS